MKFNVILACLCFPLASFAASSNATKLPERNLVKVNEFNESVVNFISNGPEDQYRWIGRLHTDAGSLNALLINSCYILTYSEACNNPKTCRGSFEAVQMPTKDPTDSSKPGPVKFMYSSPAKVVAYGDTSKGEPHYMVLELPRDKSKRCLGDYVNAFAPIKPLGDDDNLNQRLMMAGYRDQNDVGLRFEKSCSGFAAYPILGENCSARHGQSASAIMLEDTGAVIALLLGSTDLPGKFPQKRASKWDFAVLVDSFYPLIEKYLPKRTPQMVGNKIEQNLASR